MGLGKTLQIIALVVDTLEHKPEGLETGTLIVCPVSVLSEWTNQLSNHVSPSVKLTYHVCECLLLALDLGRRANIRADHGAGRDISLAKLRKFDVVITAYPTLSSELAVEPKSKGKGKKKAVDSDDEFDEPASKKRKSSGKNGKLFSIPFKRVVLDEGHVIKNPKVSSVAYVWSSS